MRWLQSGPENYRRITGELTRARPKVTTYPDSTSEHSAAKFRMEANFEGDALAEWDGAKAREYLFFGVDCALS